MSSNGGNGSNVLDQLLDSLEPKEGAALPTIGGQVVNPSVLSSSSEQRQVNNNTSGPVSVATGGALVKIFTRPSGGAVEVIEIAMQTEANAHLQLYEGTTPITATRMVQQYILWSTPGKRINADLYLQITEANVNVDVDVRYCG